MEDWIYLERIGEEGARERIRISAPDGLQINYSIKVRKEFGEYVIYREGRKIGRRHNLGKADELMQKKIGRELVQLVRQYGVGVYDKTRSGFDEPENPVDYENETPMYYPEEESVRSTSELSGILKEARRTHKFRGRSQEAGDHPQCDLGMEVA